MQTVLRETLQRQLAQVPSIIDLYAKGEPTLVDRTARWLQETESALTRLRRPEAALMATLRGRLIAAKDGFRDPEVGGEMTPRKVVRAAAAYYLSKAESVLRERIALIDAQLDPIRNQMAQLISACHVTQPIPLVPTDSREQWLRSIWTTLQNNEATRPWHVLLTTTLGLTDRLYLLDELLMNLSAGVVAPVGTAPNTNLSLPSDPEGHA